MLPIPELNNVYYFEVKIEKSQDPRYIYCLPIRHFQHQSLTDVPV